MGFDTSYHPIDMAVVGRLHSWILGHDEPIDDLVDQAATVAKVRHRANAWGLAAMKQSERVIAHLHVWGRPFFITSEGSAAIATDIDRYLAARPSDVDAIAVNMLEQLEPGLPARVEPDLTTSLPEDAALKAGLRARVDLLRACCAALRHKQSEVTFQGQTCEPRAVVGREAMDIIVEFAAHLRPGWMSRGMTWPTYLLHDHPAGEHFLANIYLVAPIFQQFQDLRWSAADAIDENYMVGGLLDAKKIPDVRQALAELPVDPDIALARQKLDEALADAHLRRLAFAEATEIYSGIAGAMN